jgi:hypothetical protein
MFIFQHLFSDLDILKETQISTKFMSVNCTPFKGKRGNCKVQPRIHHERPRVREDVYLYSFFGWVVRVTPWLLYLWERYPVSIVQEAGWDSWPVWTGQEDLTPTGI